MGWAHGVDIEGRDIGYAVRAKCDHPYCSVDIWRGVDAACGGMHDDDCDGDGFVSCNLHFCDSHLYLNSEYILEVKARLRHNRKRCYFVCFVCSKHNRKHASALNREWKVATRTQKFNPPPIRCPNCHRMVKCRLGKTHLAGILGGDVPGRTCILVYRHNRIWGPREDGEDEREGWMMECGCSKACRPKHGRVTRGILWENTKTWPVRVDDD